MNSIISVSKPYSTDSPRGYSGNKYGHERSSSRAFNPHNTESTDWKKAAEAWASRSKNRDNSGKFCFIQIFHK